MEHSVKIYAAKVQQLRNILANDLVAFAEENPDIPAQILMAGLGELLIQFSLSQVSSSTTQLFLDELKAAVKRFGDPSIR